MFLLTFLDCQTDSLYGNNGPYEDAYHSIRILLIGFNKNNLNSPHW